MNLTIAFEGKSYEISLERVNQWCGQNAILKSRILRHLGKYFSGGKYYDWEEEPILLLDGEKIGRKSYQTIMVHSKEEMISLIRNTKTGLFIKLLKERLNAFNYQDSLERIDMELTRIFSGVEEELFACIPNLSINYEREYLFDIVQKSELLSKSGDVLEKLHETELLETLMECICEYQYSVPNRIIVIIENIDHLVERQDYRHFIEKSLLISRQTETYFIFTTSLDGYVYIDQGTIEGVSTFNDLIFSFPESEHMCSFILDSFPYAVDYSEEDIYERIKEGVHRIGKEGEIISPESETVRKLVNRTMGITNCLKNPVNSMVFAFLKSENMVK